MSKLLWNALKLIPVFFVAILLLESRTSAEPIAPSLETSNESNSKLQQIDQYSQAPTRPIAQITSVSQLSDVQPTDWAFQALQSLVERYGCITGYPNSTYRGNRALTRYEFAAGLNSCLDRVNELIAAGTSDLVRKEDLATLQRLQAEFGSELTTLRGRVDTVEERTAQLEASQFSTTTKLAGEAVFAISGVGGEARSVPSGRVRGAGGNITDNEVFGDRVRLALNTSFTGRDLLRTRLQTRNIVPFDTRVTGTYQTRLAFEGNEANTTFVDQLFYRFPLGKNITAQIDASNVEDGRQFPTFSPFESSALGSISRYGRFSPIFRVNDNSLNTGNGIAGPSPGVSLSINPQGAVGLNLAYVAASGNTPGRGSGIANGSYAASGQIDINAGKFLNLGLTYSHTYNNPERFNGLVNIFDSTGTQFANAPFGNVPTSANYYGVELSVRPNKHLIVFGWGGYTQAIAERSARFSTGTGADTTGATNTILRGSTGSKADIWYYAVGVAFPDAGKKGSLLGFLFGVPPRVTSSNVRESFTSGGVAVNNRRRVDNGVAYHAEAFYRYRLNDNIDLTPGVLIIFNPEANNRNPTDYVGTLRTTFRF